MLKSWIFKYTFVPDFLASVQEELPVCFFCSFSRLKHDVFAVLLSYIMC